MTETPNEPTGAPEPTEPTPSEPTASSQQNLPADDTAASNVSGETAPSQHDAAPQHDAPQPNAQPPIPPQQNAESTQPENAQPQHNAYQGQNPYVGQQSAYAPQQNPYAAQQAGYPQPHYAGQSGQYPQYGATAPIPGAQQTAQLPRTDESNEKSAKKRGAALVIAGLAIGAIIGGASGAGVMGIVQASQPHSAPAASTGAGNITVNNASDATVVTAVAAKASPSVVTISVDGTQESGTGSGVILSSDGYVLTNTHVVTLDGEIAHPTITVTDNDGKIYTAKIVGTDPIVDLAVIKLNGASGMTPAAFADSTKLNVGDKAVAIGAPLGLSGTVTDGIVSALNRSISIASSAAPTSPDQQQPGNGDNNFWNFDLPGQGGSSQSQSPSSYISLPVIQTDAAINPGNSGGALLNAKGQVIGINVAIASAGQSSASTDQSGSIGVGFAIPSDLAQRVANELIKNGKATHGLLGATVKDASKSATTVGAQIASVSPGGAAADAGVKAGDIVTNFNGTPITSPTDLTAQVRYLPAGGKADLTYQRNGASHTVSVTLGSLPANS